ncbi:DUF748 domain-containing protein [Algiphilus sp.]|uniref:DUF748 domain-containing protein n=1 Tax=Algiphilus sp. TaxID=1872431 RepID=UPI003B51D651
MATTTSKHLRRTRWLIGLLLVATIAILLVHVIAPRIVLQHLNTRLAQMPEHNGAFAEVSMQWWRGSILLQGLVIRAQETPDDLPPLIDAPNIRMSVTGWRAGDTPIRAELTALRPVVTAIADAEGRIVQFGFGQDWVQLLQDLVPLTIQALQMEDGVLHLRVGTEAKGFEALRVSALNGRIHRVHDDKTVSGTLNGQLPASGALRLDLDSASSGPMTRSQIRLDLSDVALNAHTRAIEAATGLRVSEGRMDADARIEVNHQQARGGIDATIAQLRFGEAIDDAPFDWMIETLLGAGVAVVGTGEHDRFGVHIPVQGRIQTVRPRTLQELRDAMLALLAPPLEWRINGTSSDTSAPIATVPK